MEERRAPGLSEIAADLYTEKRLAHGFSIRSTESLLKRGEDRRREHFSLVLDTDKRKREREIQLLNRTPADDCS